MEKLQFSKLQGFNVWVEKTSCKYSVELEHFLWGKSLETLQNSVFKNVRYKQLLPEIFGFYCFFLILKL